MWLCNCDLGRRSWVGRRVGDGCGWPLPRGARPCECRRPGGGGGHGSGLLDLETGQGCRFGRAARGKGVAVPRRSGAILYVVDGGRAMPYAASPLTRGSQRWPRRHGVLWADATCVILLASHGQVFELESCPGAGEERAMQTQRLGKRSPLTSGSGAQQPQRRGPREKSSEKPPGLRNTSQSTNQSYGPASAFLDA